MTDAIPAIRKTASVDTGGVGLSSVVLWNRRAKATDTEAEKRMLTEFPYAIIRSNHLFSTISPCFISATVGRREASKPENWPIISSDTP